jgi:hypothetical protein
MSEATPGETLDLQIKRGDEVLSIKVRMETPRLKQP